MVREPDEDQGAQSLKARADTEYKASNLKSALEHAKRAEDLDPDLEGISEMVTSLKILEVAAESPDDWYKILQVEPFTHINTIKKQYKKLALILHPDKNHHAGSEEAFKHVSEAFRFLSDKIRRKEYDMKLRIQIQEEKIGGGLKDDVVKETFWTACSTCKLSQQFEKSYLGQNLVCPGCRKSFKAVEAEADDSADQENRDAGKSENSRNLRSRRTSSSAMRSGDSTSEQRVAGVEKMRSAKSGGNTGDKEPSDERLKSSGLRRKMDGTTGVPKELKRKLRTAAKEARNAGLMREVYNSDDESIVQSLRRSTSKIMSNNGREALEPSSPKRAKTEEMMTLAEMQSEIRRKARHKMKEVKSNEKEGKQERREQHKEARQARKKGRDLETEKKQQSLKSVAGSRDDGSLKVESRSRATGNGDATASMVVEDSDFYDFDKDRVERSFKTGQVWAIYDDDDGMPRHYGLIEDVTSVNPFEVKMSWLDAQSNGDEELICREKMGFHVCCGRFRVSRQTPVKSLNIFSHAVNCERAAREIYRIYPRKGSVWALYKEEDVEMARRKVVGRREGKGKRYDIVVCLTSHSGMHGLSVAYLEKVEGLKTIFRRRELGCHAIRWVDGDEIRLFSHEIPARKLTGEEAPELPVGCWELDPASLPRDFLMV